MRQVDRPQSDLRSVRRIHVRPALYYFRAGKVDGILLWADIERLAVDFPAVLFECQRRVIQRVFAVVFKPGDTAQPDIEPVIATCADCVVRRNILSTIAAMSRGERPSADSIRKFAEGMDSDALQLLYAAQYLSSAPGEQDWPGMIDIEDLPFIRTHEWHDGENEATYLFRSDPDKFVALADKFSRQLVELPKDIGLLQPFGLWLTLSSTEKRKALRATSHLATSHEENIVLTISEVIWNAQRHPSIFGMSRAEVVGRMQTFYDARYAADIDRHPVRLHQLSKSDTMRDGYQRMFQARRDNIPPGASMEWAKKKLAQSDETADDDILLFAISWEHEIEEVKITLLGLYEDFTMRSRYMEAVENHDENVVPIEIAVREAVQIASGTICFYEQWWHD